MFASGASSLTYVVMAFGWTYALRWVLSVPLLLLSLWGIVGNVTIVLRWYLFRKRSSLIPVVGGLLGAVGLAVNPCPSLSRWWWVPLLVDPGFALLLTCTAIDQLLFRGRGNY